jgi:hypothetical protein
MANPDLSVTPAVAKRLMPARTALYPGAGVPASECLNNQMPEELVQGDLCFVLSQNNLYRFSKRSMEVPNGNTIIATMAGTGVPGRWIALSSAAVANKHCRAISYSGVTGTPVIPGTFTPFDDLAVDLDGCFDLAIPGLIFDDVRGILAEAPMTVKLRYFLAWEPVATGEDDPQPWWQFAVMINGAAPTARCLDYFNPVITDVYSVATGCSIVTLAANDVLEVMFAVRGAAEDSTIYIENGSLVVHSL